MDDCDDVVEIALAIVKVVTRNDNFLIVSMV
jgi:hypothetical protein